MTYSEQKEFFENAYATGSDVWSNPSYKRTVLRYIARLPERSLVLDLGTGRGLWPFTMVELGHKVIGLDYIKHVVNINNQEAKARHMEGKLVFVDGDALDIPLTDASIDAITDFGLLHHLHPEDWQTYKNEIDRVLKPGGHVLLSTLSKQTQKFFDFSPVSSTDASFEKFGVFYYFFKNEQIKEIFGHDFEIIAQETEQIKGQHNETLLFTLLRKKK
jgi:ubiquinone/menaquinone biosynthesis C-methylase UbiE